MNGPVDTRYADLEAAVREWCEATNEHHRAGDDHFCRSEEEHAALDLSEQHRAKAHDALSAATDRLKRAVDRYNLAHERLFELAGIESADDEPLRFGPTTGGSR